MVEFFPVYLTSQASEHRYIFKTAKPCPFSITRKKLPAGGKSDSCMRTRKAATNRTWRGSMVCEVPVTRRTFLKLMGGGVVTISVSTIPALMSGCTTFRSPAQASSKLAPGIATAEDLNSAHNWAPEAGTARWRIDGLLKVTGSKIYARDHKASDFKDWPKQENWLYALRCNCIAVRIASFPALASP